MEICKAHSLSLSIPQGKSIMPFFKNARARSSLPNTPRFLLFHKPKGYIVTRKDEKERKTVYQALPPFVLQEGWVPIGRLDKDSMGLLLFTREGALVDLLTQPGRCEKTYEVLIRGRISNEDLSRTITGISTPIGSLKVQRISKRKEYGPKTQLEVVLSEGKNRHLRRLFHALKDPKFLTPLKVLDLKRLKIGPFTLDLSAGFWRFSTQEEERHLFNSLSTPAQKD
jgi:23S rRNA pseudouridine2605 synthase